MMHNNQRSEKKRTHYIDSRLTLEDQERILSIAERIIKAKRRI